MTHQELQQESGTLTIRRDRLAMLQSRTMSNGIRAFLLWIRKHPRAAWLTLLIYTAIAIFPHERVQTLFGNLAKQIGRSNLYTVMAVISIAGGIWLSSVVLLSLRNKPQAGTIALFWSITVALIALTWRLLTVNNVELVHYPQYLPSGMLLLALTYSPVESLAWVTILGGLDECWQYWGLHPGWGIPYDFNDIFMDLLGGALGILLAIAFLDYGTQRQLPITDFLRHLIRRRGVALVIAIVISGIVLWSGGWMLLYEDKSNPRYWFALSRLLPKGFWFFDPSWGPRTIHTLSPVEGPLLILLTLGIYSLLDRRITVGYASQRTSERRSRPSFRS